MINKQPAKFTMNAKQKEIFHQLTTEKQIRLLQVLEARKSQTGQRRIKPFNRTKTKQVYQDDSQDIVNQYQDHLD